MNPTYHNRPRALILTPAFFGYELEIVREFERQGFDTTYVDERPSNGTFARALLRARKSLLDTQIDRYYRQKRAELAGIPFDIVFVVRAEATPRWFLSELRDANPHAKFVFYVWDAISKANNCLQILDLFDERYSFDPSDVARYPTLAYLPLFYTEHFKPLPVNQSRRYSLSFVGTLHPGRHSYVSKLFAGRSGTFAFFYVQARWYFAFVKYITREHRRVSWSDVAFNKLDRGQVAEIFRQSDAVLDMPQPNQKGLTIRTFEVLASGAVLVTTNQSIQAEPFFDPERILVLPSLGEDEINQVRAQLAKIAPPGGAPPNFEKYSLASWVRILSTKDTPQLGANGATQ